MLKAVLVVLVFSMGVSAFDRGGASIVNSVRHRAGMISLRNNYALSRSAYNHAKYLGRLHRKGHLERAGSPYYTGRTPFDRMARAGYPSRTGVENISYGDSSYAHSVGILMATVYHRLAFLDFRIDEIGTSAYGNRRGRIYVYDMASSAIARLCRRGGSFRGGRYVYGVCTNRGIKISQRAFYQALRSVERRNRAVVVWPPARSRVPRFFVRETPNPIRAYRAGYPITVQLNPAYFRGVRVRRFELLDARGRVVKSIFLSRRNDRYRKLTSGDFVLIPRRPLAPRSRYRVIFDAISNGRHIQKTWTFRTF